MHTHKQKNKYIMSSNSVPIELDFDRAFPSRTAFTQLSAFYLEISSFNYKYFQSSIEIYCFDISEKKWVHLQLQWDFFVKGYFCNSIDVFFFKLKTAENLTSPYDIFIHINAFIIWTLNEEYSERRYSCAINLNVWIEFVAF